MDDEIDFSKYFYAVRRWWPVIVVAALLGALAGGYYGSSGTYTLTYSLQSVVRGTQLTATDIDRDDLDLHTIVGLAAGELDTNAFEDDASTAAGEEVQVSARQLNSEDVDAAIVTIVGTSEASVATAADLASTRARQVYADLVGARLDASRQDAQLRLDRAAARLAVIEQSLATADPTQLVLTDALVTESQRRSDEIDDLNAQIVAMDAYRASIGEDLVERGRDDPIQTAATVKFGIAGLVAGALLGVAVALVSALTDRSVRTRRDLSGIGIRDLLATIPRDATDASLDAAAAAIGHTVDVSGARSVQIVPVASSADLSPWSDRLSGKLAPTYGLTVQPPLDRDAAAAQAAGREVLTVLAVRWGSDRRTDVTRDANTLAAAGAAAVPVVLYDVPAGSMSSVEG